MQLFELLSASSPQVKPRAASGTTVAGTPCRGAAGGNGTSASSRRRGRADGGRGAAHARLPSRGEEPGPSAAFRGEAGTSGCASGENPPKPPWAPQQLLAGGSEEFGAPRDLCRERTFCRWCLAVSALVAPCPPAATSNPPASSLGLWEPPTPAQRHCTAARSAQGLPGQAAAEDRAEPLGARSRFPVLAGFLPPSSTSARRKPARNTRACS